MKPEKYYAFLLQDGTYGIVSTWKLCQKIVDKVPHARHKKFSTREDAFEWLDSISITSDKRRKPKSAFYGEFKREREKGLRKVYDKDIEPGKSPDNFEQTKAKRESLKLDPSKL